MTRAKKAVLAASALALVLAGVGAALLFNRGGSSTASAQTSTQQQQPAQQFGGGGGGPANSAAFQQFRQCMERNGVARTAGQPPDRSAPAFQKALKACAQYAPSRPGGGGFGGPPPSNGSLTPGQTGAST
jgi:hypothetical protein